MAKTTNKLTDNELFALRDKLRSMGYDAKVVNIDAFDIDQNCFTHYMSNKEAQDLANAPGKHPLNIMEYGERRGLNYWYTFPGSEVKSEEPVAEEPTPKTKDFEEDNDFYL